MLNIDRFKIEMKILNFDNELEFYEYEPRFNEPDTKYFRVKFEDETIFDDIEFKDAFEKASGILIEVNRELVFLIPENVDKLVDIDGIRRIYKVGDEHELYMKDNTLFIRTDLSNHLAKFNPSKGILKMDSDFLRFASNGDDNLYQRLLKENYEIVLKYYRNLFNQTDAFLEGDKLNLRFVYDIPIDEYITMANPNYKELISYKLK